MRFDNKDFESNVQTSLKTIDKLKDSLNFEDSTKSVEKFQDALKHFSLDDIGRAVESLSDKFNWRNVFKMELLSNVTSEIFSIITGTFDRIKGELHLEDVDPISNMIGGWNKYADKTQSVATIMAATGKSMEEVNTQMERLLFFTDETSYSFTDMTSNIGKFTANGIELDDAATAMQGIATWAARSGQNAQTASRVMYNLAQAIGMGALKLQDWKSVELANMGTKEFKELAISVGLANKALVKNAEGIAVVADGTENTLKETAVTVENFRETLQKGWLDNDTLMQTLEEYGKAAKLISDIHDETGLLAGKIVDLSKGLKDGTVSLDDFAKALGYEDGITKENKQHVLDLKQSFDLLNSKEYEFSLATYEAAQEARTFGDAMAAVADAVSTGWMTTFELLFGGYDTAKKLWYDLSDNLIGIFRDSIDARNELLEESNMSGFDHFNAALEAADLHILDIEGAVRRIKGADYLDSIIKETGSFENAIKSGAIATSVLEEAINSLPSTFTRVKEVSDGVIDNYEEMTEWSWELRKGMYDYIGHDDQVQKLMQAKQISKEYAEQIVTLSERHEALHRQLTKEEAAEWLTYTELSKQIEETVELTDEQKEAIKELLDEIDRKGFQESFVNGLMNIGNIAYNVFTQVRQGFQNMFPPMTAQRLRELANSFEAATAKLSKFFEESKLVENVVTALALPFRVLVDVIGVAVKLVAPLGSLLLGVLTPIIGIVAKMGEWLNQTREQTHQLYPFADLISKVGEALSTVVGFAAEVAKYIGGIVKDKLVERFSEPFQKLVKTLNEFKETKLKGLDDFIQSIKDKSVEETANRIIEKFKNIKTVVQEIFAPINNLFKMMKNHFEYLERVKDFSGMSTLQNVFETIRWSAAAAFNTIRDKLKGLGIDIGPTIASIERFLTNIGEKFNIVKNTVRVFVDDFVNRFKMIGNAFKDMNVIERAFLALQGTLSSFGINLEKIITKLREAKKVLVEFFAGAKDDGDKTEGGFFSSIIDRLSDAKTSVSEFFKSFKRDAEDGESAIASFIKSLGITLPKVLTGAGIALTGTGIIAFIKKLKEAKNADKDTIIDKIKDSLNPFADAMEKVKTATSSFNIVSFAIGVGLLAASLIALSYVPGEKLAMSLGSIGASLAAFLGTLAAVNKIMGDKGTFRLVGMGLGMVAIAGSLLLFAKAVDALKNINFTNGTQILKVIGLMVLAVEAMGSLAILAGENKFKLSNGLGLVATAGALYLFGKALESYGKLKIDRKNILKVLGGLLAAITTFGLISKVAGRNNFKLSNGLGLIAMATSMLIFAGVIAIFGHMDKGVLRQGGESIAVLGLVIAALLKLANVATKGMGIKQGIAAFVTLAGVVAAVVSFAAVVAVLGFIPEENLTNGQHILYAIGFLVGALAFVMGKIGKTTGLRGAASAFVMLTGIAIAMGVFAAVVAGIGILSPLVLPGFGLMTLMLLPLAAIMIMIKKLIVPNVKEALLGAVAIALFGLSLIPMVEALAKLGELDFNTVQQNMLLLGELFMGFLGVMGIAMVVGAIASIAGPILLVGLGVVAGVMLAFVGAIAILVHELEKLANLDTEAARDGLQCVREELEILTDLAHQFMEEEGLFGASMEAALTCWAFGIGLNKLANDTRILGLSNASAASDALKVVQEEIDLMFQLGNYLAENEGSFSKGLDASTMAFSFGIGLHGLANDTRILGLTNAENAKAAMEPLEGLISLMVGLANTLGTDPALFGKALLVTGDMVLFGIGLLPLVGAEFLTGLANADNVSKNMASLRGLINNLFELARQMNEDPGMVGAAVAVSDIMAQFGKSLMKIFTAEFVASFIDFEVSDQAFESVKKMVGWLIEIAGQFQGTESIADGAWKAAITMKKFASALVGFTTASFFSQFVDAEAAAEGLKPVKEIVNMLTSAARSLTAKEGMFEAADAAAIASGKFAGSLKSIVKAEKRIAKSDADATLEGLVPVQTIVTMLTGMAKEFATTEGMAEGAESASIAVTSFADNLSNIAWSLANGSWESVDPTSITRVVDSIVDGITKLATIEGDIANVAMALEGAGDIFESIGSLGTKGGIFGSKTLDVSGILSAFDAIGQGITNLGNTAVQADVGNKITTSILDPITAGQGTIVTALFNMGQAMSDTIGSFEQSFYVDGNNLAVGLINGMNSQIQAVYDAGYNLGSTAEKGTRDATEVQSPSKVFAEIGGYLGEGLSEGMESKYGSVSEAAKGMAQQAVEIVSTLIERMNALLAEKQNELHISPVVDMDGITTLTNLMGNLQGSHNLGNYRVSSEIVDEGIRSKSVMPELKSLHEHLAQLGEHMDGLQVILDTGTLVGATSAKMDSQFGIMAMRRGRGN
jgi:hypothetical protein